MIVWGGAPPQPQLRRMFDFVMRPGVHTEHGRVVRVGQIWRSNDHLEAIRILEVDLSPRHVFAQNVVSGAIHVVPLDQFTIGPGGWSLERD